MTQKQVHITWGIIVVILFGVIVYMFLVNKNDYQPVTENQSTNIEFKNIEKIEETQKELSSDWKTYTNSQFSFEFKYPKDWYIVGKHTLVNNDAQLLSNYEREEDNNLPNLKADAENIFFKTYTVAENTTLDDLKPKTNVVSFEKFTTTAGLEGRKVVIYSEDQPVGNHTYFVFLQNNRVIHFSLGSMSEDQIALIEEILGTYRFLSVAKSENEEIIDTQVDWKTYINRMAFPFSIKYPSNFWVSGNCMDDPSKCSGASLIDPNNNQAIIMIDYDGAFMPPETLKTVAEREQKINNINNNGNASPVKAVTYGINKGYSFTVQNAFSFDDKGSGISLSSSATVVYFTTKGRVTRIIFSNSSPVYKEIIATFKFL